MVIQRKTVAQFEDLISNGVASRDETIDTYIGPIRDLYITPPAEVMKGIHDNIVYLSQLVSMQNAGTFNPEDLDAFVYNENVVRWNGSPSYVVVTFSRLLPPTADITIPLNFPLATKTDPKTGQVVNFRTIETRTMYGPLTVSPSSYYNVQTSRYEINVAAVSVISGGNTMVGAYTITQFRRSFPEFEYVTNKSATTTGRGLESNIDLAVRYQTRVTGNQEATPAGLKSFSLNLLSNIEDAYVVYGSDPNLERNTSDSGAVDVWVKSTAPATDIHNTYYRGVRELVPLPKQPLMSVTSVSSGATYYTEGTDFEIVTGEGIYAYSDRGQDGIRFLIGGAAPALNAPLQIVYSYNAMINIATALYKQPESLVMGSDAIFRWAQKKNLTIEAELKVGSGNPNTVLGSVRDRIVTYINSLKLGMDVEEFDIDAQVAQSSGVDPWVYVTLAVKGGLGVSDIAIGPMEYAYIEDSDLVISLV
jgi:hypothetical protein